MHSHFVGFVMSWLIFLLTPLREMSRVDNSVSDTLSYVLRVKNFELRNFYGWFSIVSLGKYNLSVTDSCHLCISLEKRKHNEYTETDSANTAKNGCVCEYHIYLT